MSGLGDSSIGLDTPFGIGTPDDATPPPTLAPQGARFLDPLTKDYSVGSDGEYLRMPTLRQRVLIALSTVKASSSVQQTAGLALPNVIDANYERRAQFSVKSALSFLVAAGEIRIDAVTVAFPRPGRDEITVAYTDLLTGEMDSATR